MTSDRMIKNSDKAEVCAPRLGTEDKRGLLSEIRTGESLVTRRTIRFFAQIFITFRGLAPEL
jgi:hypothetical protein